MNLNPNTKQAYQLLHDGVLAFSRAEQQGIRIDMQYAEQKKQHLTRKINRLITEFEQTNFYKRWNHIVKGTPNINSNPQLAHFLYTVKKLTPAKLTKKETITKKGTIIRQGSTDEDALTQLNIPELNDILEIRKLRKVRDTYLDAFIREQVNGYIHPFFNLHLVRTYRSSSDHPNFQNIPIRDEEAMQTCRKAIYPRPGHQLLEVDYSGLEVRIAACYHKDERMIKYINNPASDMHADMAKQIFMIDGFDKAIPEHKTLRDAAKNGFVFPQFYGDYYKNCAENMACRWSGLSQGKWKAGQGIKVSGWSDDLYKIYNTDFKEGVYLSDHLISKGLKSFSQFTDHVKEIEYDFWTNRFPDYQAWKDQYWKDYQKRGYIDMFTGFRCGEIMSYNDVINRPIQGSAFHCLLWSFIQLDKIMQEEQWKTRLIAQIHDSILLDTHPDELRYVSRIIKRVTCTDLPKAWPWIIIPLSVDMDLCEIDSSWADKKTVEIDSI